MNLAHATRIVVIAACLAGRGPLAAAADGPDDAASFEAFLAAKGIDRDSRKPLEEAASWNDAAQQAALRVLLRLAAPRELVAGWQADAAEFGAQPPTVGDRLVAIRGRAVFVGPQPLTAEQRQLAADRDHFDVVRIVDAAGTAVDVLVPHAPTKWPRGRAIDEPAVAYGLPLSTGVGPRPESWPDGRPALVLATRAVAWTPATPLGALGMDYALFDTVVDGRKLESGDTEALYAMLAAVARMPEAPPGPATDIVPIIDPAQKWFAEHRGDEVVIKGVARKATRIAIPDPEGCAEVGADHYWQLDVFVSTPTLNVDGNLQDSFPVVCCVRELPAGMPSGDQISETVIVPGFVLKRYAWPLPDATIGDTVRKGERRETPLVIGRRAVWQPAPSTGTASNVLFAVFASLAAVVAAALAWGTWSMRRDARESEARARAERPDKLTLPDGRD